MPAAADSPVGGGSAQPIAPASDGRGQGEHARPGRHRGRAAAAAAAATSLLGFLTRGGSRVVELLGGSQLPRKPAAERRRDRQRDPGCCRTRSRKAPRSRRKSFAIGLGLDGGGARAVGEKRHLAERLARAQDFNARLGGATLVDRVDADRSAGDQIEGVARFGLTEDDSRRLYDRGSRCAASLASVTFLGRRTDRPG